jgi:hypothetical protein
MKREASILTTTTPVSVEPSLTASVIDCHCGGGAVTVKAWPNSAMPVNNYTTLATVDGDVIIEHLLEVVLAQNTNSALSIGAIDGKALATSDEELPHRCASAE